MKRFLALLLLLLSSRAPAAVFTNATTLYVEARVAPLESRTNDWNTAFSWGNHGLAGYATPAYADAVGLATGGASTNFAAFVASQGTNHAASVGAASTNFAAFVASQGTNYADSVGAAVGSSLTNYAGSVASLGTNFASFAASRGTNYTDASVAQRIPLSGGLVMPAGATLGTAGNLLEPGNPGWVASQYGFSFQTDSSVLGYVAGSGVGGMDLVSGAEWFLSDLGLKYGDTYFAVQRDGGGSFHMASQEDIALSNAQAAASFLPVGFPATGTVFRASYVTGPQSNLLNTAYSWGDHSLVGYLTAPSIAGLVSKTYADMLMATGTAYAVSGPQSNALASALQPSWATTGTVSRAQMADMLKSPSGRTWLEVANGNTYIVEVTNSVDVYVVSTAGEGYNGPAAGTRWTGLDLTNLPLAVFDNADGWDLSFAYPSCVMILESNPFVVPPWSGQPVETTYPALPEGPFQMVSGTPENGSLALDWVPITNTYQVATQEGTVTLIGNHNADPDAHPTLVRTNHTGNVTVDGTVTATAFAGNGTAVTGVVKTTEIPGPGCTLLSGVAPEVSGATVNYLFSPTNAYTLSVSASAPRYNYGVSVMGTNACTLGTGISLVGTWTPSGTNLVVIAPSTGTLWRAYGRAF